LSDYSPKKVPITISKASILRRRDDNRGFLSTILTIPYLMTILTKDG
jgi:hypothetical protein